MSRQRRAQEKDELEASTVPAYGNSLRVNVPFQLLALEHECENPRIPAPMTHAQAGETWAWPCAREPCVTLPTQSDPDG